MALQTGERIGAYEIVALLGQGGMATVYKAYHPRLNRYVAIKMIHPAYLEDTNFLTRFQREAQIIAALEHPHIVPVYDFSEHDGEPYLVMKLIEGSTLKEVLAQGLLPGEDILTVLEPIASALDYAHRQGVLHRDVKPSNIILDQFGTPYLSDFGLARLSVSGATTLSQDLMIGTPYYMSPEQAVGKGVIDHRADLYSFGVVLYELFVGQVPFSEGTPYAIINDHVVRELPLPHTLNPDVSIEVEIVLLKALSKDPDDRYASASAMIDAMKRAVSGTSHATQPSILERQSVVKLLPKALPSSDTREAIQTARRAPVSAAPKSSRTRAAIEIGLIVVGIAIIVTLIAFVNRNATLNAQTPTQQVGVVGTSTVATEPLPTNRPATSSQTTSLPPTNLPPTHLPQGTPIRNRQRGGGGFPPPPPTVMLPPISIIPLEDARAAVAANPNQPGSYLSLAAAQLRANDDLAAWRTINDLSTRASDSIPLLMGLADYAVQVGRYDAAFLLYNRALREAEGVRSYQAVRIAAGEYLYSAATLVDRLTIVQIRALNAELERDASPIASAMIGRAFLTSGYPVLAEVGINAALAADPSLAEAHLVNGELLHANGDVQPAFDEWEIARAAPDAPQWVRDRATQLIDSLNS